MSNYVNVPLGKQVETMDTSPQFQPYSGVEIVVDEETSFFAGNNSGRILRIENPWGSQQQAEAILANLETTGFQYQPYSATGALLNPAAEIGDGVTINGLYSGVYKLSRNYSSLMSADIEAPQDEEVDHEYPFEPKQDRIFKREIAEASAKLTLTQSEITAEVLRATEAEGNLSSRITQNATSINAKVSSSGGNNSSFAWTLTSAGFTLTSANQTVFKCTSSGVEISGKVTAKSGQIGGFTIGSSSIYKGTNSLSSNTAGVYVGTNGIRVVGTNGSFTANSSGNVTLTGSLKIGDDTINANNLRLGASRCNSGFSGWNGSKTWTDTAGKSSGSGVATVNCQALICRSSLSAYGLIYANSGIRIGNYTAKWASVSSVISSGGYVLTY